MADASKINFASVAYQLSHQSEDRSIGLKIVSIISLVLAVVFVALRLASRRLLRAPFKADDYVIIVALVCCPRKWLRFEMQGSLLTMVLVLLLWHVREPFLGFVAIWSWSPYVHAQGRGSSQFPQGRQRLLDTPAAKGFLVAVKVARKGYGRTFADTMTLPDHLHHQPLLHLRRSTRQRLHSPPLPPHLCRSPLPAHRQVVASMDGCLADCCRTRLRLHLRPRQEAVDVRARDQSMHQP